MAYSLFPQHIIARKRDGGVLAADEIAAFVRGATDGSWADFQLSALLMAIFIRGMTLEETVLLTDAMKRSGFVASLDHIFQPKADKHSTGGVGDKISLHLAPMVAACGVTVPMISGRGLGHTGGTLDKLEAIPGFKVTLPFEIYRAQLERIGVALVGQTAEFAPADRKLYSLRDVTGTVESIPLICASILAKKLAEGTEVLVLDVKFGRGAFMQDKARAKELAQTLVAVANRMQVPTRAILTAMDQPLGRAVGNALEVIESIECLKGNGPADTMELTYALGAQMLLLAQICTSEKAARTKLAEAVSSGHALHKFREMIIAQKGDAGVIDDVSRLPTAPIQQPLTARKAGTIQTVDALSVALAALRLGAGRAKAEDKIDAAVGLSGLVKVGERVEVGSPLCTIHARNAATLAEVEPMLLAAISIGDEPVVPAPLIDEIIG